MITLQLPDERPDAAMLAVVMAQAITEHRHLDRVELVRALTYALNLCEELDWDKIEGANVETLRRSLARVAERLPK